MITDGAVVFLGLPDDSGRCALHRATVVGSSRGHCTIRLAQRGDCPPPSADAFLYRDVRGRFMRQTVRIETVLEPEPQPIVFLRLTGYPVSAERRQSRRVSFLSLCDQALRELQTA